MSLRTFKHLALLGLMLLTSACGTITSIGHVGYDKVYVSTDQEKTTIKLNGVTQDMKKGYIMVDKGIDGNFITCTKDGYKNSNFYMQRKLHPGVLTADIILSIPLIFIPLIVDGINGELYEINPQSITIFMTKDKK